MGRLLLGVWLAVGGLLINPLPAAVFMVGDEDGVLWNVNPVSGSAGRIGDMGVVMTDIAFSPSGELFGISPPDDLYRINLGEITGGTVPSTFIGSLGISNPGPIGRREIKSLEFDAAGTLYFATFAPLSGGELGAINLAAAELALVGTIGRNNGGGLAFSPRDGSLFMNSCRPTGFQMECSTTYKHRLVKVNSTTGAGTEVGRIGFPNIYGLDFVGNELVGITLAGELLSVDTVTGTGTVIAETTPTIRAYGASSPDTEHPIPPPPQRFDSHLPELSDAKNLVLVAHGWNVLGGQEGEFWTHDLAGDIGSFIETRQPDPADWQVVAYDWRDLAGGLLTGPGKALRNGSALGAQEGYLLAARDYDHVHLVGNSAGAALVDAAADQIKFRAPDTKIHVTFLDAYAPTGLGEDYGDSADWADHYLNSGDWPWTSEVLPYAHNVNVTGLNPTLAGPIQGHAWPREFYAASLTSPPEYEGYGFPLSREAASDPWNPKSEYPIGEEVVLNPPPSRPRPEPRIRLDDPLNLAALSASVSDTGSVEVSETTLTLATGSPVWYTTDLIATEPINFLAADIQFTSDPGAEGLLGVYFDDRAVGLVDERFAFDDGQPYRFYLGEAVTGIHRLAFRLDSFTDVTSSVAISNVSTGSYQIPEPSAFMLLACGVVTVFFFRKATRKN